MKKIMNILLGVLMVITVVLLVYAIATGGSEAAISVNLIWCYVLIVAAIAAALFSNSRPRKQQCIRPWCNRAD